MDKVYPIFFDVLKLMGVKNPTKGMFNILNIYNTIFIFLDLFTPFVIILGIGFLLGFISSYMILKINELELKNKIIEKQILEMNNIKLAQRKKEEIEEEIDEQKKEKKSEEKDDEKEPLKEEGEKIEEVKKENNNINIIEEIVEEKYVPHEIKQRKVEEEEWTTIKKNTKKKKP